MLTHMMPITMISVQPCLGLLLLQVPGDVAVLLRDADREGVARRRHRKGDGVRIAISLHLVEMDHIGGELRLLGNEAGAVATAPSGVPAR